MINVQIYTVTYLKESPEKIMRENEAVTMLNAKPTSKSNQALPGTPPARQGRFATCPLQTSLRSFARDLEISTNVTSLVEQEISKFKNSSGNTKATAQVVLNLCFPMESS